MTPETTNPPEAQDEGWLPTIQDDIDRLRDMIRCHEPPEECPFDTEEPCSERCPPARRNACILPMTGYQPLGQNCPLRFCSYAERTVSVLNDYGISIGELLDGDYAAIATNLMLGLLKHRKMATDDDCQRAEPKSPDEQERWEGVRYRNYLRGQEIVEARFCLLRDLKVRRDMPKDLRRALRRLKESNWDYLTPQERAKKEGRRIPAPEETELFSLLGIKPPRNLRGIGKHPSPDGNGPPLWLVQLAAMGRADRERQERRLAKKQLATKL
jgi:hypothetical protein